MADAPISALTRTDTWNATDLFASAPSTIANRAWTTAEIGGLRYLSATAAITIGSSHRGFLIGFNTSATAAVTLPASTIVGPGWWSIIKNETSFTVYLAATSTGYLIFSSSITTALAVSNGITPSFASTALQVSAD